MAHPGKIAILLMLSAAGLTACGKERRGALDVVLVGAPDALTPEGVRLGNAAQLIRAATADGLVRLDESGEVVPALADRWIVADEGRSYIFRLADREWPDGTPLSGDNVAAALKKTLRDLRGTSLALDLASIAQIRAMAGRVVEIDLSSPMPNLLLLLAQPEMALFRGNRATGLMSGAAPDDGMRVLKMVPPEMRGLPAENGWKSRVRSLHVSARPAGEAIKRFNGGDADIVIGGQFDTMPLSDAGPLSRGTVRLDGVTGLLGLQVVSGDGFLADPVRREALAMAVDRDALLASFNIAGWQPTTRVVAPGLQGDLGTIGERWADSAMDQRRAEAARRVADWLEAHPDAAPELTVAMPKGPGADAVFGRLRADFGAIGLTLKRKDPDERAQLRLVDSVARFADPLWFLNQFNCTLRRGQCSPAADARVAEAVKTADPAAKAALLAEAEADLTVSNVYIPFGGPLRWSLVRGSVTGFVPNRLGFHPLPPLAVIR